MEQQSSAKTLKITSSSRRVSLVRRYRHSPPIVTRAEGSAQLLDNGDLFVGWGNTTNFSEYAPGGRQIFNATFAPGVDTYRAYRFSWTGRPGTPPSVAVKRSAKGVVWLYASWNGATQIARWRAMGGSSRQGLKPLKSKRWSGFETAITLPAAPRYLAVQALDVHGHVLGRSRTVTGPPLG